MKLILFENNSEPMQPIYQRAIYWCAAIFSSSEFMMFAQIRMQMLEQKAIAERATEKVLSIAGTFEDDIRDRQSNLNYHIHL